MVTATEALKGRRWCASWVWVWALVLISLQLLAGWCNGWLHKFPVINNNNNNNISSSLRSSGSSGSSSHHSHHHHHHNSSNTKPVMSSVANTDPHPAYSKANRVFLPSDESMRGVNLTSLTNFTNILGELRGRGGDIRFVFGFSPGHVGAASISSAGFHSDDVRDMNLTTVHENGGVPTSTYNLTAWTLAKEIEHAEYYYLPEIMKNLSTSSGMNICMDLSHTNLYFYRGLIHVLTRNHVNFTFIRIHRQRHELAYSMTVSKGSEVHFFWWEYFRYHPFENENNVVLKMNGNWKLWLSLSMHQRVLWVIDETEARWQALLREFPSLERSEIHWSITDDNILRAVTEIAAVIGVRPNQTEQHFSKPGAHGKHEHERGISISRIMLEDEVYRKLMNYTLAGAYGGYLL
jgi:hypothetical protein